MKKFFLFLVALIMLAVFIACKPACAQEDDNSLKPGIPYLALDKNDFHLGGHQIDLQFYSPFSAWQAENDTDRWLHLWKTVKDFEKFNPNCAFGAIQPQVDEKTDRFMINIWCVEHGKT